MPIGGIHVSFSEQVTMHEIPSLDPELKSVLFYSKADIEHMKIHDQYMAQYRKEIAMARQLTNCIDQSRAVECCINNDC